MGYIIGFYGVGVGYYSSLRSNYFSHPSHTHSHYHNYNYCLLSKMSTVTILQIFGTSTTPKMKGHAARTPASNMRG